MQLKESVNGMNAQETSVMKRLIIGNFRIHSCSHAVLVYDVRGNLCAAAQRRWRQWTLLRANSAASLDALLSVTGSADFHVKSVIPL